MSRLEDEVTGLTAQWEGAMASCNQTEDALRQAGKRHAETKAALARAEELLEESKAKEKKLGDQLAYVPT